MEVTSIIAEIDMQIQKLQQARDLLAGTGVEEAPRRGPGRPKGSKAASTSAAPAEGRKRKLSPEGRRRIAEAMKRRWAERAKASDRS